MPRAIWECETVRPAPSRCVNRIAWRARLEGYLRRAAAHCYPETLVALTTLFQQAEKCIQPHTQWRPKWGAPWWCNGKMRWTWGDASRELALHLYLTADGSLRGNLFSRIDGKLRCGQPLPITPEELGRAWLWVMQSAEE